MALAVIALGKDGSFFILARVETDAEHAPDDIQRVRIHDPLTARLNMVGFWAMLEVLKHSPHRTVCVTPGLGPAQIQHRQAPNLRLSPQPVHLEHLLPEADLAIGYGPIGTTPQTLLSGLPQLLIPAVMEQALCARKVEEMGAGIHLKAAEVEARAAASINCLLDDATYRNQAQGFAERHRSYNAAQALDTVIAQILDPHTQPVGRVSTRQNGSGAFATTLHTNNSGQTPCLN